MECRRSGLIAFAYRDDATYDDSDNKIIWKSGDSPCSVDGICK